MLKEERQAQILNKLHTSGKVVVSQLAADLQVSEDTVRRDLLDLDQKGMLKRVFGGAIPLERPVIGFFDRESANVELKQKLSERALGFLEPDQLVAIDGSSTNLQFAKNIPSDMKLTVLTNSYSIAHVCSMKERVRVIVLGGDLLKDSMTTVGETAAAQAAAYHPDLCFMGVYAIHPEYGMTIPYPEEVSIKRQLIGSSRRVIALVDPVKLNTVSLTCDFTPFYFNFLLVITYSSPNSSDVLYYSFLFCKKQYRNFLQFYNTLFCIYSPFLIGCLRLQILS